MTFSGLASSYADAEKPVATPAVQSLPPMPSRPEPLTREEMPLFRDLTKQIAECDKVAWARFKKICEKKLLPGGLRPPRGMKVPKDARPKYTECTNIFKSESLFRCAEARAKNFSPAVIERWRFQNWKRISTAELDHQRYEDYRARVDDSEWLKEF